MRTKQFYDIHHASNYMNNSIVRVDGFPVVCKRIVLMGGGDLGFEYEKIHNSKEGTIAFSSQRVDLNPVPLGMFGAGGDLKYLVRVPSRRWKIGLDSRNTVIFHVWPNSEKQTFSMHKLDKYLGSQMYRAALDRTIRGKYSSFKEALEIANNGTPSVFSRRFAIHNCGGLVYKYERELVGDVRDGKPKLKNRYQYLQQALDQDIAR